MIRSKYILAMAVAAIVVSTSCKKNDVLEHNHLAPSETEGQTYTGRDGAFAAIERSGFPISDFEFRLGDLLVVYTGRSGLGGKTLDFNLLPNSDKIRVVCFGRVPNASKIDTIIFPRNLFKGTLPDSIDKKWRRFEDGRSSVSDHLPNVKAYVLPEDATYLPFSLNDENTRLAALPLPKNLKRLDLNLWKGAPSELVVPKSVDTINIDGDRKNIPTLKSLRIEKGAKNVFISRLPENLEVLELSGNVSFGHVELHKVKRIRIPEETGDISAFPLVWLENNGYSFEKLYDVSGVKFILPQEFLKSESWLRNSQEWKRIIGEVVKAEGVLGRYKEDYHRMFDPDRIKIEELVFESRTPPVGFHNFNTLNIRAVREEIELVSKFNPSDPYSNIYQIDGWCISNVTLGRIHDLIRHSPEERRFVDMPHVKIYVPQAARAAYIAAKPENIKAEQIIGY